MGNLNKGFKMKKITIEVDETLVVKSCCEGKSICICSSVCDCTDCCESTNNGDTKSCC